MSNLDAYVSKLIYFLCFVQQRCEDLKLEDNMIITCDEIAIWQDAFSKLTVEVKKILKKYPFTQQDMPKIV